MKHRATLYYIPTGVEPTQAQLDAAFKALGVTGKVLEFTEYPGQPPSTYLQEEITDIRDENGEPQTPECIILELDGPPTTDPDFASINLDEHNAAIWPRENWPEEPRPVMKHMKTTRDIYCDRSGNLLVAKDTILHGEVLKNTFEVENDPSHGPMSLDLNNLEPVPQFVRTMSPKRFDDLVYITLKKFFFEPAGLGNPRTADVEVCKFLAGHQTVLDVAPFEVDTEKVRDICIEYLNDHWRAGFDDEFKEAVSECWPTIVEAVMSVSEDQCGPTSGS